MVNRKPRLIEGLKLHSNSKGIILKRDVLDLNTKRFLHSEPFGLFFPVRKIKRRIP